MSGCVEFESSMTGSSGSGPLQPPEDSAPLVKGPSSSSSSSPSLSSPLTTSPSSSSSSPLPLTVSFNRRRNSLKKDDDTTINSSERQQARLHQKMTPVRTTSGQPIQLTPLWEHVVRTQRFPAEVDTRETFNEISERLRDPEWEVRQHALRVLVDVLPTLNEDIVDEAMLPVLPELVNNLGHLAPAVRKGALDTLRVYLVCSGNREDVVKGIFDEGLSRPDSLDNFQTNVTLGVILSTPSLLFPSSSSPRPSKLILNQAISALAMRLIQATHQEAAVRSLVKIHEIIGSEEFDIYLNKIDVNAKRDYEVLCDIYKVKPVEKNSRYKNSKRTKKIKDDVNANHRKNDEENIEDRNNELNKKCDCSCDNSGIDNNEINLTNSLMPTTRIVLETEIKFNEETAITMTILEEKDDDSEDDDESDAESGGEFVKDEEMSLEVKDDEEEEIEEEVKDNEAKDEWIEKRKTPRRVHFGGEIVKLRTPDSDDSEIPQNDIPLTRIPVPISPTTKMPEIRMRRSVSNPSSPSLAKSKTRKSRSVSNSPKREFYTHDASLSPKKSILSRTNDQNLIGKLVQDEEIKKSNVSGNKKIVEDKMDKILVKEENDHGWAFEICDNDDSVNCESTKSDRFNNTASGINNRQVSRRKSNLTKDYLVEVKTQNAISNSEVKGEDKVEKAEEVKRSGIVDGFHESYVDAVKDKQETMEQEQQEQQQQEQQQQAPSTNLVETKSGGAKDPREVVEKFVATGDGNGKSPSVAELPRRFSPIRSPKKLAVFDSFPRKERNYILMELSSPVKTETRKINESSEVIDDNQRSALPENVTTTSRGNSPMGSSVDHLFLDTKESLMKKHETVKADVENSSPLKEEQGVEKEEALTSSKLDRDKDVVKVAIEETEGAKKNDNIVEGGNKCRESNWEELGLVDQEVLNDLHNKDDWRARVRGLERVASALRTSSALIAIESRLGSLLHAVLGGERSCRVAAAGMAVARVVVAGVSEEALKRRLPQVAWGLARQGGPNAAQLARIAMLRLRPALLLEQLLQPHCIKARNAKTRENALQLLIFSLVTFPSTEFKVENVANKVVGMVADRRRRVRQAALDTLAVLAQIYEPEEVMQAGKRAAKSQQDGDSMVAAIRARLARKSLPMVSADGLVVYGLQISPTVQIATGPDVDWIVAGSGSVSPGTGRTRGQIIATTTKQGVEEKNAKNESTKNSLIYKGPNFVALGVGLHSRNEQQQQQQQQPFAWQLVQHPNKNDGHGSKSWESENRDNIYRSKNVEPKSKLTGSLRQYRSASDRYNDSFNLESSKPTFLLDGRDVMMKQRKTEEKFQKRMDEIYAERTGIGPAAQEVTGTRLESRIPVAQPRDREMNGKESRIGTSYARRRLFQEGNNLENWSSSSSSSSSSVLRNPQSSRPRSIQRVDQVQPEMIVQRYQSIVRDTTIPSSSQRLSPTRDNYRSIYRQRRNLVDGNVYREVQTASTTSSTTSTTTTMTTTTAKGYEDNTRRRESLKDNSVVSLIVTDPRGRVTNENDRMSDLRSRKSNDPTNDYGVLKSSIRNGDKTTVEEDEYNEINGRHYSDQKNAYNIQNHNDRSSPSPARISNVPLETSSNASSNTSGDDDGRLETLQKIQSDRIRVSETIADGNNENSRASPSRQSPMVEKSFDVITHETNPSRRNSIEYGISTDEQHLSTLVDSTDPENEEYETDKGSSTDDASSVLPGVQSSSGKFVDETREKQVDSEPDDSDVEDTENKRSTGRNNVGTMFVSNGSNSSDCDLSKVSDDTPESNESNEEIVIGTSNLATSPARIDSMFTVHSTVKAVAFDNSRSSTDDNDEPDAAIAFVHEYPKDMSNENASRIRVDSPRSNETSATVPESFFEEAQDHHDVYHHRKSLEHETGATGNTVSIVVAPRPQSRGSTELEQVSFQPLDFRQPREVILVGNTVGVKSPTTIVYPISGLITESPKASSFKTLPDDNPIIQDFPNDSTRHGKINRSSSTGNESAISMPEINGAQSGTSENNEGQKRVATSRVPRIRQKTRGNLARVAPMPSGQNIEKTSLKSKPQTQQCFVQLESNDWEVAIKGLKALSLIARQQPEQLDSCAPGMLGRLLGRHVRNLRSQVSRAACLAAGDVFGSQARCIDQDLDDIAGPLLHRTADTNKFLRADSNGALDRMVEHLPPNKTIGVIVHRGATHQNAVVRAATARLLGSIVDRVGPDWAMSLPRDVREKLVASGAKLLMDGNLDARNHAKKMFRKLAKCEGFRKVLTDSVPEATLRHIDKTLKSL